MALTGHSASWHKASNTFWLATSSHFPRRNFVKAAMWSGVDQGGVSLALVHARN